jgi:hypothetical protein
MTVRCLPAIATGMLMLVALTGCVSELRLRPISPQGIYSKLKLGMMPWSLERKASRLESAM